MELLYHCYRRIGDHELHCPLTGQQLRVLSVNRESAAFEYRDRDRVLTFAATFDYPPMWPKWRRNIEIDWNAAAYVELRECYGFWRRTTWFLLDALLAWSYAAEDQENVGKVSITGGWANGEWRSDARSDSGLSEGGTHRDKLVEPITPFEPFSLDTPAPTWRFEPGLPGAREGRIATVDVEGRLPLADLSVPVERQLAQVPRFIGSDGSIFFFHRVTPHVGPEYAPGMSYGLIHSDFAFYFGSYHCSLIGSPIRLRPDARDDEAIIMKEEQPDRYRSPNARDEGPRSRPLLHPRLKERLFFATAGAHGVSATIPNDDMPKMRDLKVGQEMRFGYGLGHISEPPMSIGLPHAWVSFYAGAPRPRARPAQTFSGSPLGRALFGRRNFP